MLVLHLLSLQHSGLLTRRPEGASAKPQKVMREAAFLACAPSLGDVQAADLSTSFRATGTGNGAWKLRAELIQSWKDL